MIKATDLGDSCIAACEQLDTKDYVSILWASTAEFPGTRNAILAKVILPERPPNVLNYCSQSAFQNSRLTGLQQISKDIRKKLQKKFFFFRLQSLFFVSAA